jgi:hypothetical protein
MKIAILVLIEAATLSALPAGRVCQGEREKAAFEGCPVEASKRMGAIRTGSGRVFVDCALFPMSEVPQLIHKNTA